jgi:hypothetical protein
MNKSQAAQYLTWLIQYDRYAHAIIHAAHGDLTTAARWLHELIVYDRKTVLPLETTWDDWLEVARYPR